VLDALTGTLATQAASSVAITGGTISGLSSFGVSGASTFTRVGTPATFTNTTDSAAVQGLRIDGDRATPTNSDLVFQSFLLSDLSGTQTEVARISGRGTTLTAGAVSGEFNFGYPISGTFANRVTLNGGELRPFTSDALALGSATGQWSDLFLASGGVLNFANGNWVATHTSGILTVGTGDLRVTTAGTDTASVVTVGGSQTLTNKTLTTPAFSGTPTGLDASTTAKGISEFSTAAEFRTGTDTARSLVVDQVWASAAEVTLSDAATIAVDMATFFNATVTLGGNRTLGQPSNTKVGQSGVIRVVQPGSGGPYTLAYHADWEFAGGSAPVLSTAANAQDLLFYQVLAANRIFAALVKGVV
jgi:hypothetical protein